MIYTSYYAGINKLDPVKSILVQISNSAPVKCSLRISEAIPSWKYIVGPHKSGLIDDEKYIRLYQAQLNYYKDTLISQLDDLFYLKLNPILLCYEAPNKFCHRHILADWYNELKGSELITEYKF